MSLSRQFVREFRPLFRMLEEPFGRQHPLAALPRFNNSVFNDPFFRQGPTVPAVDLTEDGNQYVVEAELPGIQKENIEIRVGDNGQSLTIEGKTFTRSAPTSAAESQSTDGQASSSASAQAEGQTDSTAVTQTNANANQLSTERTFTGSSSFSRTIWLPQRVNGSAVTAKLTDGILTLRIPKAEDTESVSVKID